MKTEHQDNADLAKLAELIEPIETAMLTTHGKNGTLVSRPLQTLKLTASGELIFFTSADSDKVAQLTEDHAVNLAYAQPSEQRYLSVRGRARMDRDRDLIDELWTPVQKVFFPAGKDDPQLMVLRIKVRDAVYWEADSGNWLERAVDFAEAFWSDEPEDLGTSGRLEGS